MDMETSNIVFLMLFLASTLMSTILVKHKRQCTRNKNKLPPGELGLPWVGETLEFLKAQRNNQLYEGFVQPRIEKYGDVFKTRLMGYPTFVVNGAEANRFFLSNEFKLVVSSWPSSSVQLMGKNSIMESQGEHHRFLRGIIATTLSCSGLEDIVPKMCNIIQLHLNTKWKGKEEISLYRSTKILTFSIVFECLFGIKVEPGMMETFERVLEGVFAPPLSFPGSRFSRAKKARREIEKMLLKAVRDKRKEMESNQVVADEGLLLSKLVNAMIKGEIKEEEVIDNVVLLVFAAHDTTSFAIAMTFKMLAQHPDCHSLVLQENLDIRRNKKQGDNLVMEDLKKMKYTWQLAKESMRLFPPIFGSFRKAITDIEFEGFTIPKGWKVLWTTYGTHYNSKYFQDPHNFNPERFIEPTRPYVFLPFGGGPRICAGYQLAKLNILSFVHLVATQYDWSLIHPDEPITFDPLPFPSKGLPIKITSKSL